MRKVIIFALLQVLGYGAICQEKTANTPAAELKNEIWLDYIHHISPYKEYCHSNTCGNTLAIEWNRVIGSHFRVGAYTGLRQFFIINNLSLNPFEQSSGKAVGGFQYGLVSKYSILSSKCEEEGGWNAYLECRIGGCKAMKEKNYFEYSIGMGNEYFFTRRFGVKVSCSWGNAAVVKLNGVRNPAHVQLSVGLGLRF